MTVTLGLAGDTMLGRGVAEHLAAHPPESLFAPEVVAATREADLFVLNLECCVSERGTPWPDPDKPFFFRAPPAAVEALRLLEVDCVTLANNHALDFGEEALLDTFDHLEGAGIAPVGAGPDEQSARAPATLESNGFRLAVLGVSDHPRDFAAAPDRPGIAYADLRAGAPDWLKDSVGEASEEADAVLVSPHWGPNMTPQPVAHVRSGAEALVEAGATVVAGHSAHVFHGVQGRVLFDLGDFVDDYAVNPRLRNDLGLLWLVELDDEGPTRIEGIPLRLDYCRTGIATGEDRAWIADRFRRACADLGTEVQDEGDRLVVADPRRETPPR